MKEADPDIPKTYHLAVGYRKSLYIPIVLFGALYVFGMIIVTVVRYDRIGIWSFQIILAAALVFSYMLIRRSRTRLSFYEDHLYYYGTEITHLLKYRMPWNAMQEIIIEFIPVCRTVIQYRDTKGRRKEVRVLLYRFPKVREIIERLSETARTKGIPLREV